MEMLISQLSSEFEQVWLVMVSPEGVYMLAWILSISILQFERD